MKQYLLFAGQTYYPKGGFDDLIGSFDAIEEALSVATRKLLPTFYDDVYEWYHVIDLKTFERVANKSELIPSPPAPVSPPSTITNTQ